MKKILTVSSLLYALPFVAFAAPNDVEGVIKLFGDLINLLIPLLMAVALIAFFWGLVLYIWRAGDGKGQEEGKKVMIAGIVGLFLMVGIWGIVNILQGTFGTNETTIDRAELPSVNFR